MKQISRITSIDLYTDFPAAEPISVSELEDTACGIYPCYYLKKDCRLIVSTSALSIVRHLGNFKRDYMFNPPNFYKLKVKSTFSLNPLFVGVQDRTFLVRKGLIAIYLLLKYFRKHFGVDLLSPSKLVSPKTWYVSWRTIDRRVKKLRPFERVTSKDSFLIKKPTFNLKNSDTLIEKSVFHIKNFITSIERRFPEHKHIILTSGLDSQIIVLCPKINNKNWYVFSAIPNADLVESWIMSNKLPVQDIFKHDNINEESFEDYAYKILCSDLYSDLRHIRWMPAMKKIADRFDQKCIFWGGSIGDAIFTEHSVYHSNNNKYFEMHRKRAASMQGNYHQVFKNYVGCPYLSPYHSKEIWDEVIIHMDPEIVKPGKDYRKIIAQKLYGRKIRWINENPCPKTYEYKFQLDPRRYYFKTVNKIKIKKNTTKKNEAPKD